VIFIRMRDAAAAGHVGLFAMVGMQEMARFLGKEKNLGVSWARS